SEFQACHGVYSPDLSLFCSAPNYGVGQGKAILETLGQRMVVAQSWVTYRRPELSASVPWARVRLRSARTAMKLAKPRIDIGFATNNAPAALAFWQNRIGLPFDHTQPIRRGLKQHRHDLCGSILKIN